MSRIRVLVVAPEGRLARALARSLPPRGPVAVAGPVGDEAAIEAISGSQVDLVVVDLDRADGRGLEVIGAIVRAGGAGRVLGASERGGADAAANALTAGASGMLPTDRDGSLVDAFRRALAGEMVLPAEELPRLVTRLTASGAGGRRDAHLVDTLTPRERDILRTLAAGASTADVAEAFGITPLTVQSHVKSILAKLGVHSKVEAVRIAWRQGLATSTPSSSGSG